MVKKGQNFVHDVVIECPPFQVPKRRAANLMDELYKLTRERLRDDSRFKFRC